MWYRWWAHIPRGEGGAVRGRKNGELARSEITTVAMRNKGRERSAVVSGKPSYNDFVQARCTESPASRLSTGQMYSDILFMS